MNSELVQQASEAMTERLFREAGRDEIQRIRRAYARTLGREPTATELSRARAFVESYGLALAQEQQRPGPEIDRPEPWQALCRVLMGTSEFLFVD